MAIPTFSIIPFKTGTTSVKEGKKIRYNICRDNTSKKSLVSLGVNDGSAKGGKRHDYQVFTRKWARNPSGKSIPGTLLFKKGEECKTITVKTYKDNEIETDESFSLYIKSDPSKYNVSSENGSISTKILDRGWYGGGGSNGGGGSGTGGETGGNSNSNSSQYFVKDTYNFNEGEEAYFTIIRTKPRRPGSVNFTLSGYDESRWLQPAEQYVNYDPVLYTKDGGGEVSFLIPTDNSYHINFKKGEGQKKIYVQTLRRDNDDCSFYALSININEGRSQSSKYFEIKDVTEGENTFTITSAGKVKEGEKAKLTITREDSCGRNGDRDIYLHIDSGTANSSDYEANSDSFKQKISFRNGETEKVVEIPIIEDCISEGEEYFYYSITGASQQDQTPRDDQDIPRQYKQIIEDVDCISQPTSRRYWDDSRRQWVDEVTATIDSTFSHDGTLLFASDNRISSMQNRDTFILTPKNDGSLWKPEIQLNGAPSNTKVDIMVHPYLPNNLGRWDFRFYDETFVNTTIDCYEYVGLKSRANKDDVLKAINEFSPYSSGQRYVNGEPYGEIRHDPIDLNRSLYLLVSMSIPGEAKEEGYFPGMGMGGPYCTDPLKDTPISYTLTLTEVV